MVFMRALNCLYVCGAFITKNFTTKSRHTCLPARRLPRLKIEWCKVNLDNLLMLNTVPVTGD